jgi:hypothetical protein
MVFGWLFKVQKTYLRASLKTGHRDGGGKKVN